MDAVSPFVHEFTYEAMANDLLPIEGGRKYVCVSYWIRLCSIIEEDFAVVLIKRMQRVYTKTSY